MAFTKIVSPGIDTTGSYTVQELNTVGVATAGTVQVGSATTIHTTGIDLGSGNITSHNINSTGIITATSFVGPVTGNITGDITATSGTFSGNVSIAGTLTYEDVTNIDSVGIITARGGLNVGPLAGIAATISANGRIFTNSTDFPYRAQGALVSGARAFYVNNTNNSSGANYHFYGNNADGASFTVTTAGQGYFKGDVGIGTDNPFGKLQVHAGDDANFSFSTGGGESSLEILNDAGSANVPLNVRASEYKIKIQGNEKLRISNTGLVGIGTNNPDQILTVRAGSTPQILLKPTDATPALFVGDTIRTGAGQHLAEYRGNWDGTTVGRMVIVAGDDTTNKDNGEITFNTATAGSTIERLRIGSAGELSISGTRSANNVSDAIIKLNITNSNGDSKKAEIKAIKTADVSSEIIFSTTATHTFAERMRIADDGNVSIGGLASPGALLHLRDSDNTTQGAAQLKVSRGVGSGAAPTSTSRANCYIHLGSSEWGSGANGQYLMGFGYTNGETGTGIPAYIGFKETSTSGYTVGDLIFGTRDNTTGTNNATERFRITSAGTATFKNALYANPLWLTSSDSWIRSGYGAITNSTVQSLNNLMIAQNIRGYVEGIEGGSVNNNFYSVVTHSGMGYAGTEYCYGGITKFYNGTGASTANNTITPNEVVRINSNGITVGNSYKFGTSSSGSSLVNPYVIGNVSSNSAVYPHTPGIYFITASVPCDNTWRTLLTSINDSAFVFHGMCGDASSKRSFGIIGNPTSPSYGVNVLTEHYNVGGWNAGGISFRLDGSHPNWNLQVKSTSYYSTSNIAGLKMQLQCFY